MIIIITLTTRTQVWVTPQNAKTAQESFAQTMESVSAVSASEYDHQDQDQFLSLFKILNLFSNLPKLFYVTHTQLLLHINHVEYHDLHHNLDC